MNAYILKIKVQDKLKEASDQEYHHRDEDGERKTFENLFFSSLSSQLVNIYIYI